MCVSGCMDGCCMVVCLGRWHTADSGGTVNDLPSHWWRSSLMEIIDMISFSVAAQVDPNYVPRHLDVGNDTGVLSICHCRPSIYKAHQVSTTRTSKWQEKSI